MRYRGEQPEGGMSAGLTEGDELKKLSPEARVTRERVDAGRAAQEELQRIEEAKAELRGRISEQLDTLSSAVGTVGKLFNETATAIADSLSRYRQKADEGSRSDQAFISGVVDFLRDLKASREAQERLRGQA